MIKITVENVEGMEAHQLRRIAGLFSAIAQYAGTGDTGSQSKLEKFETETARRSDLGDRFASDIAKDYAEHEKGGKEFNPFNGASLAGNEGAAPSLAELDPAHAWPEALIPALPPVPQAAGIDVDSKGSPWDGRIHASTRAKVADGTWRMKRGADDSLVASVKAEIAQTMAIPVLITREMDPTRDGVFIGDELQKPPQIDPKFGPTHLFVPPLPKLPSVSNAGIPALPLASTTVTASAGAATTASPSNFLSLMKGITAGFADKSITQENINMACSSVGVPSLPMLSQRPDLIGKVALVLGVVMA